MAMDHEKTCGGWVFWMGALLIFLTGCMGPSLNPPTPSDLEKEMKSSLSKTTHVIEEGSLWSPNKGPLSLYADVTARNVGDIVTISIVESAKASKNASTKTGRNSGLEAGWSGIFDAIAGNWSINDQKIGTSHAIDFKNTFDGQGETTRASSMTAYITARVVHVLSNGNLVIQGTRQVKVNNENQFIRIQGIIRPEDISSRNVILSTYVAEAVIELSGYGTISDKQSPGLLFRLVDWVWPF